MSMLPSQATTTANGGSLAVVFLIYAVAVVFYLAVNWKLYTKAGQPGWAAIIPIYNIIVFLKIIGRPWWWLFLLLIPVVNIVFSIIACIDLSKVFGKGGGFGAGLFLLGFIFFPVLAFGSATYLGPPNRLGAGAGGGSGQPGYPLPQN
jgi:hypothetical protein